MIPGKSSLVNESVTNISGLKLRGSKDYSEYKRSPSKEASEFRRQMSGFETYQAEFRRNGWNLAGANLLSLACSIARQNFIYVRPRLALRDFVLALIFSLVIGSFVGGLAWAFNPVRNAITTTWYAGTVGFFIGSLSGGGYLLRKASHWQPMEEIIRQQLNRSQQRELVAVLLNVCADLNLDPERPDTLLPNPPVTIYSPTSLPDKSSTSGQFVFVLLDFFRTRLKMQQ